MSRQSWPRNAGRGIDICTALIVLSKNYNTTEYHLPKSRASALNISMDSISISSPSLL